MEFREIEFRSPTDPNLEAVAELLNEEWPGFDPENLYRKYSGNPAMKPGTPHFLCVYEGGRLAAANGYLPAVYRNACRIVIGVQDCDSYVSRAFRGRGIFTKLVRYAEAVFREKGYDFLFGFPNGNSIKTYQNLGWVEARIVRYTVRFLNVSLVKSNTRRMGNVLKVASVFATPFIEGNIERIHRQFLRKGYRSEMGKAAAYLEYNPPSEAYRLALDPGYIAWRFPDESGRYFTVFSEGPEGTGRVLASYVPEKRSIRVLALEGGCIDACSSALSYLALHWKEKAGRIMAWAPSDENGREAFIKSGFLRPGFVEWFRREHVPFFYKDLTEGHVLSESVWNLRYADHDSV